MKNYYWIFGLMAVACHQPTETTVRIHLESKYAGEEVKLTTVDSVYKTVADSLAEAVFVLPGQFTPGYSICYYKINWIPLYIEPGKNFEMICEEDSIYFVGLGKDVNNYLNSNFFREEQLKYELEENDFIESLQQRLSTGNSVLDTIVLGDTFKQIERKRLYYAVYQRLKNYPFMHARAKQLPAYQPSDEFVAFYKAIMKEDDKLVKLGEYRRFFEGLVNILGKQGTGDRVRVLQNRLNYIGQHIQGPHLAAYLTDLFMTDYLSSNGIDGLQEHLAFYDAKVSDTTKRAAFRNLYAQWEPLAKGQPAPSFQFTDVNGKSVHLSDLRGKYVYIDVWATWCYFCCKEIPPFERLAQKFAGRNIHFVGISCDKDREAWKKKVKEDKMGGIQLNIGDDENFMKSYIVPFIPRFILLDREGRILNINMTRPSDPETFRMLDTLPGM